MAKGDHLFVYCGGYSHHGIDVGDGNVIHFDSTPFRKFVGQQGHGGDSVHPDHFLRRVYEGAAGLRTNVPPVGCCREGDRAGRVATR